MTSTGESWPEATAAVTPAPTTSPEASVTDSPSPEPTPSSSGSDGEQGPGALGWFAILGGLGVGGAAIALWLRSRNESPPTDGSEGGEMIPAEDLAPDGLAASEPPIEDGPTQDPPNQAR